MRLVRELAVSSGLDDYLYNVTIRPIAPWFSSDWYWYALMPWYDVPVLPGLVCIALALSWRWTGARLARWILR